MAGASSTLQTAQLLMITIPTLLLHVMMVDNMAATNTDANSVKRMVARLIVTSHHQRQQKQALEDVKGCGEQEAQCPAGKCIPLAYLCDGEEDCTGGWDEKPMVCKRHPCEHGWVHCPGSYTCIQAEWICDGEQDCPGSRDESKKMCNSATKEACPEGKYPCHKGGGCLEPAHFCDGEFNCMDKSDEVEELCLLVPCPEGTSRCTGSTECITQEWECDGEPDCLNGADENMQLCASKVCSEERVKCETATGNHLCLWRDFLCDGQPHCAQAWDEQPEQCGQQECSEGEVRCDDNSCVAIHAYCRGWQVCRDGSQPVTAFCDDFYTQFYRRHQEEKQNLPYSSDETDELLTILRQLFKQGH